MREERASSSDGSDLERRVFVSLRESSYMGRFGDGERLALGGEEKKSVT
jgi:hypothetical protein